jgi:hypothetical protein
MDIIKEIKEGLEEFKLEDLNKAQECKCKMCYNMHTLQTFLFKIDYIKEKVEELEDKLNERPPEPTFKELKKKYEEIDRISDKLYNKYRKKEKRPPIRNFDPHDVDSIINAYKDVKVEKPEKKLPSWVKVKEEILKIDPVLDKFVKIPVTKYEFDTDEVYKFVDPKKYSADYRIKEAKKINVIMRKVLDDKDLSKEELLYLKERCKEYD